jgi:hypothetical protein
MTGQPLPKEKDKKGDAPEGEGAEPPAAKKPAK